MYGAFYDPQPSMTSILVDGPEVPVLTLDEGKLRAGLAWASPDPRDQLMEGFIATATSKVELDTAFALITQTRDVLVYGATLPTELILPSLSRPLQSVESIGYVDDSGAPATVVPSTYAVDRARGRIRLASGSGWPTNADPFGLWTVRIIAGWAEAAALPPLLVQAVGILTAHLATFGRDLVSVDDLTELPYGYDDCIAQYRPVRAS